MLLNLNQISHRTRINLTTHKVTNSHQHRSATQTLPQATMIGRQDIRIDTDPTEGVAGQVLPHPIRLGMYAAEPAKYTAPYYATATLINARNREVNDLLRGTRRVDGENRLDGCYVFFDFLGLSIRDEGRYAIRVDIWEAPGVFPANTNPTHFGSIYSSYLDIKKAETAGQ
jgi:hypothetical protein